MYFGRQLVRTLRCRNLQDSSRWIARGAWALVLTLLLTTPASAVVELLTPVDETPPTSEDLNGVAVAPGGDFVVVGDNATVLHRTTDPENNPIWTSLASWAAGFFSAEIFTVEHSPVAYPAGDGWVIGGRETLVETDFTTTMVVDQRPGTGSLFTPVLATSEAIWYGVPDLGLDPSFLHRYDRATQTAPGIAFPSNAVLALCLLDNGDLRYVTTDGDIEEIDHNFQVTVLHDQDDLDSLELNAASFSEDCSVLYAGDVTSSSRVYAGFVEAIGSPGPTQSPWRFRDRPGEPSVTATCILTPQDQANIKGFFGVLLRCEDDVIETGDDATMSAFKDLLESRILKVETANLQQKCQRDVAQSPADLQRVAGLDLPPTADFQVLTVGTNGRVQRILGTRALFFDSFESGDLARWSSVSP